VVATNLPQAKRRACELTFLHAIPVEAPCIQHHSRERSTMCPFCIANVGLVVASTVSTGGLATLAIKVFRKKNQAEETASNAKEKEK
jgi:hypothetical protein